MIPTLPYPVRQRAALATSVCVGMLVGLTWPLHAMAQPYPAKPVTLVVPYPPGGATDTVGRILAKAMAQRLGQPVLVDNKAGAGTAIGAGQVAQAAPDGYTLLISSNTTFTVNPALKSKLPYDPLTSFESIGIMGSSPLVLLAKPSPTMPGVPSIAQAGYPGFEMVPWITVVAPRGLPAPVRASLTRAFADSLLDADTRAALVNVGVDVQPEPPLAYERRVADELPKLRSYVHKAGLSVE